ncbi:hypothetical protein SAY87_028005 [Trapa incisa]|uniref:DUF7086 domain-containing protein n=1 Tax=Trapa incisa TaxID=236973 RepID=A0AAN7L1A0_9MYRT|nr:hypothetical protein SAY87_028005 [Trapa incisa]
MDNNMKSALPDPSLVALAFPLNLPFIIGQSWPQSPHPTTVLFAPGEEVGFLMSRASAIPSSWPVLFQEMARPQYDPPAQMPLPPPPPHPLPPTPRPRGGGAPTLGRPPMRVRRKRGRVSGSCGSLNWKGKAKTITPPYPWATDRRAVIHRYSYLISNGLTKITGEMHCRRCDKKFEMEYDLKEKFALLGDYIAQNLPTMHHRASVEWMYPAVPDCPYCQQANCVRPVFTKKKAVNWLFLLLGQLLGFCKLSELRYFCKHTSSHRTGAKDRILYSTYLGLCKQLDPSGPFSM